MMTWSRDVLCDDRFDGADMAKTIIMMWAIWTSRNNITHEKARMDHVHSLKMIRDALAVIEIQIKHAIVLQGHV